MLLVGGKGMFHATGMAVSPSHLIYNGRIRNLGVHVGIPFMREQLIFDQDCSVSKKGV